MQSYSPNRTHHVMETVHRFFHIRLQATCSPASLSNGSIGSYHAPIPRVLLPPVDTLRGDLLHVGDLSSRRWSFFTSRSWASLSSSTAWQRLSSFSFLGFFPLEYVQTIVIVNVNAITWISILRGVCCKLQFLSTQKEVQTHSTFPQAKLYWYTSCPSSRLCVASVRSGLNAEFSCASIVFFFTWFSLGS